MTSIALIYPEVYEIARFKEGRREIPPFGVMYLASTLEQLNFEVQIIAVCFGDTQKDLRQYDVVGYSIPSSVSYDIIKESIKNSRIHDNALVMVGGVHATIYPEETLLDLMPHVLCIGEGEITIQEIVEHYQDRDFSNIKGVCYLRNGKVNKTHTRRLITDIGKLPLPSRHLLPEESFILNDRFLGGTKLRMTHVMFARGCPFHCHFCASTQKKMQYRSGISARKELLYLKEQYGIEGFSTVDDNTIINQNMFIDFCSNIRDLGLKWKTLSRIDQVDTNILQIIKKSGCVELQFGFESGSRTILKKMNKKITIKQIYNAITNTYENGINIKLFIVHGYPGENMQTTLETITLLDNIKHMISRVNLFRFVPLPGSYVYENPSLFSIRGTHRHQDWEGSWEKFHIYHNDRHWWGDQNDFQEMNQAFSTIESYIKDNFSK